MNKLSWRHHYIPEFYLNGFTNSDGNFKIYDVERGRFLRKRKDFSPKSFFYEKHGNTFIGEDSIDDNLEKEFYSKVDSDIAQIFDRIRNSEPNTNFGVSDNEMPALQYFASMLYWRIPNNYEQIKHLIKTKDIRELGIIIKNKKGDEVRVEEIESRFKKDPNFFKMMKFWLPIVTYPRLLECGTPLTIQSFPKGLPSICSDNPIIFLETIFPDIYIDDLIFPLTNELVLIRGNEINNVLSTIKIEIDLIVLKQAKKYVCCTDPIYITMLNRLFVENYSSVEELKGEVFNKLITRNAT